MKRQMRDRKGLSVIFSFIVFIIFLITAFIVAAISLIVIKAGIIERFAHYNIFVLITVALFASVIIGTFVSPIMGRIVLKPIRMVIAATNQLASGNFSTRLDIERPSELRELADSFNRMAYELGSIELLRSDFVNNFSHEFKTPIVSIKGFAEMLKLEDLTQEERNEYLNIVISESGRLAALATNVLNLSKVENQTILSDKQIFDLAEQIRRCILMFESNWEQKKLSLSVDIQDIRCIGNEEFLSQVWLNLLDNAVKFTPEGGEISVILGQADNMAKFVLRDNGPGISADYMEHIFDKFYQADTSHATEGNGLGLALVKKIVQLHGGSIECKSSPGEGTEFTVSIPLS